MSEHTLLSRLMWLVSRVLQGGVRRKRRLLESQLGNCAHSTGLEWDLQLVVGGGLVWASLSYAAAEWQHARFQWHLNGRYMSLIIFADTGVKPHLKEKFHIIWQYRFDKGIISWHIRAPAMKMVKLDNCNSPSSTQIILRQIRLLALIQFEYLIQYSTMVTVFRSTNSI